MITPIYTHKSTKNSAQKTLHWAILEHHIVSNIPVCIYSTYICTYINYTTKLGTFSTLNYHHYTGKDTSPFITSTTSVVNGQK